MGGHVRACRQPCNRSALQKEALHVFTPVLSVHSRVPVVLDRVVCSAWEQLCDLGPAIPVLHLALQQDAVLFLRPTCRGQGRECDVHGRIIPTALWLLVHRRGLRPEVSGAAGGVARAHHLSIKRCQAGCATALDTACHCDPSSRLRSAPTAGCRVVKPAPAAWRLRSHPRACDNSRPSYLLSSGSTSDLTA